MNSHNSACNISRNEKRNCGEREREREREIKNVTGGNPRGKKKSKWNGKHEESKIGSNGNSHYDNGVRKGMVYEGQ